MNSNILFLAINSKAYLIITYIVYPLTQFFVSAMPLNTRQNAKKVKENILIKGRTYRKGDENGKI